MTVRLRQDAIVRHLRRNGTATLATLAQTVGASRRTVLRDLNALRDEGWIIHAEPGRGGGIQLDPRSMRATVTLSVEAVFALVISTATLSAIGGLPFTDAADRALAQLEAALPSDKLNDLRRLLAGLFVGQLAPEVDITGHTEQDPDLLPAFEQAFLQCRPLRFDYVDAQGQGTHRCVEPHALLILPPLWYLVAWDPQRGDFRHFRMDRIRAPRCTDEPRFLRRDVAFDAHVSPLRNLASPHSQRAPSSR
ncbi:helix-turn-helix transcriptional regulator [Vibrio coralliilyticus]|uniref:helix-turn-helix transcriptional regulator n=1 Tax=Vibrio coralliilyticus TaxID=190893 RepID=UPI00148C921D|nr:WYL domain-containing protein [Vibrio coralliilyticus]NOI31426.1 WYL domain-containing protein [Vibrio coralliilyticus]NOI50846.1 WYL domain-containing protein [Vibrio coralliilyticus]